MVESEGKMDPDIVLYPKLTENMKESIYCRLQKARLDVSQLNMKKSGINTAFHYKYYELDDFLPQVQLVLFNNGLCPIFVMTYDEATLEIRDILTTKESEDDNGNENRIIFRTPVPAISTLVSQKLSGCQAIGMLHAYFKRYLYLNALEICETDLYLDGPTGGKDKKEIAEELKKIYEYVYNNPDLKNELTKVESVEDANNLIKTGSLTQNERRILDRIMRIIFGNKVYFDPIKQKYVTTETQKLKERVEYVGREALRNSSVATG
jgi:hypothetical protein